MRYRFHSCELDTTIFELRRSSKIVHVPRGVFELILYLLEHRSRPVGKDELVTQVWQGRAVGDSSLSRAVSSARALLGDSPRTQHTIKTLHGRGYWFVAPVEVLPDPPAETAERSAGASGHALPFVGRDDLMRELSAGLDAAMEGRSSTWLVAGEPGVGKSRLLEEFAARARAQGAELLMARSHDDDAAPSLWLWIQVLRSHLGSRAATPPPVRPIQDLLGLLPELRSAAPARVAEDPVQPAWKRFRLFDATAELLRRGAEERTLAILLDDLQDADPPSLELLRFLTRSLPAARILIVGTHRDPPGVCATEVLPALAALAREEHTGVRSLEALTPADVGEVVARLHLSAELASPLHERSGGNPFFLAQLVSLLGRRGAGAWPQRLPASVHEAILGQLQSLPEPTQEILASAAVIGREFSVPLLAQAVGAPCEQAVSLLAPAEEAGVVEERQPGIFAFSHGLVRDAIYARLSAHERSLRHRDVSDALAAELGDRSAPAIESLAYHTWRALPLSPTAAAVTRLGEAARWASRRFAFERAVTHCERALAVLEGSGAPDDSKLCDLLLELARAQIGAGLRSAAYASLTRAAAAAQEIDATERLAQVALAITPGFLPIETGVVDSSLVEILERALEKVPESSQTLRARLLARLAIVLYWSVDAGPRRHQLVKEAERCAAGGRDPAADLDVRMARYQMLWGPDSLVERARLADQIRDECARSGQKESLPLVHVARLTTFLEAGRAARVDREIDALERAIEEARHPHGRWYPPMYRTMRLLMRGRYTEAEEGIRGYVALAARFGDPNAMRSMICQQGEIAWQTGRAMEAVAVLERQLHVFSSKLEWESALAFAHAMAGRREDAEAGLGALIPELVKADRNMNWMLAAAALADACVEVGNERQAELLYACLSPYRERCVVVGYGILYWGSVARRLGALAARVGRPDEADAHLAFALEVERRMGALPWQAATHLAWANALRARSEPAAPARIGEHAGRARRLASALGMKDLEERARRLEASGTAPAR